MQLIQKEIIFIPPSQKTTAHEPLDECEERPARRDVTKWACYSCRRDNPALACKGGVNKGTTGMPVGLFSIKMKKLQYKLIQTLLLTSTFPLIILAVITVISLENISINEAHERIINNLNIVQSVYNNIKEDLKYVVRDENRRIFTLLENGETGLLRDQLKKYVQKNKMGFFTVTDAQGKIIISVTNPKAEGGDSSNDNYVQKAKEGETLVSTEVLTGKQLQTLGISEQAKIPANKNAQGLVIRAALPVINREEKIVGTMSAGYLLNNNKIILEEIKRATGLISSIFLEDLRISSNIPSKKGEYAVGSRLDSEEAKKIIREGYRYVGRMSILGKWYISGYLPIHNSNNNVIASIGISIPETYVFALRDNLIKIFTFAVLLSIILALIFGLSRGGSIVKSVEQLRQGTEAVTRGDYLHKIHIHSKDEIEELANFFNKMIQELKIARKQVEEYSKGLEDKVEEKTSQLESAHKKLIEYEKMAAMGRMATTLGHELRNIFAGIRTVTYILKSKIVEACPDLLDPVKDLEYEVNYGNDILDNVLRFSLPKKLILADADINLIIEEVISSLNLEEVFKNIELTRHLDPDLPKIKADSVQMREVVLNIIINAVQAMPEGGKLSIGSAKEGEFLKLEISDTGKGIAKKVLDNLFVPFFTTKRKGLGLGLFISNEIVKAHRGKIEVDTQLDKGTTFKISLPLKNIT